MVSGTIRPPCLSALLDVTNRGEIVIDPFLGSGSTLIAADATGRVCRGVELDPRYVDVIVRRYEASTGNATVAVETGETFEALAARRCVSAPDGGRSGVKRGAQSHLAAASSGRFARGFYKSALPAGASRGEEHEALGVVFAHRGGCVCWRGC